MRPSAFCSAQIIPQEWQWYLASGWHRPSRFHLCTDLAHQPRQLRGRWDESSERPLPNNCHSTTIKISSNFIQIFPRIFRIIWWFFFEWNTKRFIPLWAIFWNQKRWSYPSFYPLYNTTLCHPYSLQPSTTRSTTTENILESDVAGTNGTIYRESFLCFSFIFPISRHD
jgi:hypothetical protein